MLSRYLEFLPSDLDENGKIVIDVSNYDYCLIQPIGDSAVTESTVDSGAIQGVSDGGANSAQNFINAVSLSIEDGLTYSNTILNMKIGRLEVVGKYVRITAGGISKLLIMLAKIS